MNVDFLPYIFFYQLLPYTCNSAKRVGIEKTDKVAVH